MKMENGYANKVLEVDLTTQTWKTFPLEEELKMQYLGGSGIGTKILFERTDGDTDPLGPENTLIFMTGPFAGNKVPTSGRHQVIAKSPLTGIFGEGDVGGTWGTMLKKAGYDGIVVTGASEKPVGILVDDEIVKILDLSDLWGKDSFETDRSIKERYGPDFSVACIGPSGERQILCSCIVHDGSDARVVGRCGLGAVMGSKGLKAIAVRGKADPSVFDPEGFAALQKKVIPMLVEKTKGLKSFGTSGGLMGANQAGDLPVKNWSRGDWDDAVMISGQRMAETILRRSYFCATCPIGCGRDVIISTGPYAGVEGAGPEYETLGMLGSACLVNDLEAITYAADICNRWGLDTIEVGSAIAMSMELYERGIITREDLEGKSLEWGDAGAMISLVEAIAKGEGFGKILGMGVRKAAETIGKGAENYAIQVKGLAVPAHDPRCYSSMAVGYATSNRGACHLQGSSYFFEKAVTMPEFGYDAVVDRFENKGKGKLNFYTQNIMSVMDSLKICKFTLYGGLTLTHIQEYIRTVTGMDLSLEELKETGERIYNLKRLYNIKCGIGRKDDILPERFRKEPRHDSGTGEFLPDLETQLEEYYQARGWNKDGVPLKETLQRLGIA